MCRWSTRPRRSRGTRSHREPCHARSRPKVVDPEHESRRDSPVGRLLGPGRDPRGGPERRPQYSRQCGPCPQSGRLGSRRWSARREGHGRVEGPGEACAHCDPTRSGHGAGRQEDDDGPPGSEGGHQGQGSEDGQGGRDGSKEGQGCKGRSEQDGNRKAVVQESGRRRDDLVRRFDSWQRHDRGDGPGSDQEERQGEGHGSTSHRSTKESDPTVLGRGCTRTTRTGGRRRHEEDPGPAVDRRAPSMSQGHSHPFDPDDPTIPAAGITVADGVIELDTLLGGWEHVTAGYRSEGDAPVLVETGSQSSVPALLDLRARVGLGASDLAGVVVTHIHLDHAGGVGDVARAFPGATIYVHQKGARHLADPTKLIDSASRVYGPLLDSLYGRLDPTPPERIHVLEDGEAIRVSPTRSLMAVDSTGHAKHHLALHDSLSGVLFAGDAVGVKLPDGGVLRPSTPPPDFDLQQALHSLQRFAERRPSGIALAHYGLLEQPEELLAEAEETLRQWAETAEKAYREGTDIADALSARFDPLLGDIEPGHKEKLDIMNGVHSNAAGFRRWLEGRDKPPSS